MFFENKEEYMKKKLALLVFLLVFLLLKIQGYANQNLLYQKLRAGSVSEVEVFFSPDGGCKKALLDNISQSRSNILIHACTFTSDDIAKAIVKAKERKVEVVIILDGRQEDNDNDAIERLTKAGVTLYIDSKHRFARINAIIIDCFVVITGSYHLTESSEEYYVEDLVVITNPETAKTYSENWKKHREHSILKK